MEQSDTLVILNFLSIWNYLMIIILLSKDFVMLVVSQDTKGRAAVAPYVEKNGFHFTILLDPENSISSSYEMSGVPETFIIDRKGKIVAHHMGAFDWSRPDVRDALQQLLDSKAG